MNNQLKKIQRNVLFILLLFLGVLWSVSIVWAADPTEIRIGSSISKGGFMASFGLYSEWGYTTAVEEANKAGGIYLSKLGKKLPVKLIMYDDESRPERVAANTERLILKDEVHGLLSPATPPLVLPAAFIAEREGVPMSAAICPIRAFLGAKDQWNWVWDIFFDELDMTRQQFLTMDTVQSNRKVALFTDNEQDGVVMGKLWNKNAPEFGYEIVYHAKFPVGTSEYGDLIRRAQEAKAEIVIAQMIPPDAIAVWKQMQALGYKPKAVFFEKGGEPVEWWKAHGPGAQGTMVVGYWHSELKIPGARALREKFEKETGATYSQHIADTYVAAQVLLDAIERAGELNPEAINKAISKTDKEYVIGHVKYTEGKGAHAAAIPTFMLQWQNGDTEIVFPKNLATAKMIYPLP